MRVLKYLKFFEEAELTLGELEKERGGEKRGNALIKKLQEPEVKLTIKGEGERTIDHIKVDGKDVVPSIAANAIKKTNTNNYDDGKGAKLFGKPRYKDVFISGKEVFKLNQVKKTSEFGAVGPGVLTRKYEAIQCLFIAFKLRFPLLVMNKENVIDFWERYEAKDAEVFKKIGIYLDSKFVLTREIIDSLSTNLDWLNTFMKVPDLLMEFKGMFSANGARKYSIFLESNKDIESPVYKIINKYNSLKKGKSNVNFSKFCPGDIYIVVDSVLSEINKNIDNVKDLPELVNLMDKYFDKNEFIPISLKKLKEGDKIIINKEKGKKLPDFIIERFIITDDPLRGIASKIKTRSTWVSDVNSVDVTEIERSTRDIVFDSSDTGKPRNIDGDISGKSSRHGKITLLSIKSILRNRDGKDLLSLYNLELDEYVHLKEKTNNQLRKEIIFVNDDLKLLVPSLITEIKTTTSKGVPSKMYTNLSMGSSESNLTNKLISKLQSLQLLRALAILQSEQQSDADYVITRIMRYALSIQTDFFENTPRYLRII